jgi:hypothetical protein
MNGPDIALIAAGILGAGIAVVHGVVMQRYIVSPIEEWFGAGSRMNTAAKSLVPILLNLTSVYWLVGGVALIAAALWFNEDAKFATAACVAFLYLCATVGNFVGTRGRHPGWMLYAVSLALIAFGVSPSFT